MVRVRDVVLGVRQRLGDTDASEYRYAPMEIIDAINQALADLSDRLLCFPRTWIIPLKSGVYRYHLPDDFLRLISVRYNGSLIETIKSLEAMETLADRPRGMAVALDPATIHLYPDVEISEEDRLELSYYGIESINDESDTLKLPSQAKMALIYHVLGELYDAPVRKNGTEKSNRYRQLYLSELAKLRNRLRGNMQSKRVRSPYVLV